MRRSGSRVRRKASELSYDVPCRHEGCTKRYASETAMLHHMRIKHSGTRADRFRSEAHLKTPYSYTPVNAMRPMPAPSYHLNTSGIQWHYSHSRPGADTDPSRYEPMSNNGSHAIYMHLHPSSYTISYGGPEVFPVNMFGNAGSLASSQTLSASPGLLRPAYVKCEPQPAYHVLALSENSRHTPHTFLKSVPQAQCMSNQPQPPFPSRQDAFSIQNILQQ